MYSVLLTAFVFRFLRADKDHSGGLDEHELAFAIDHPNSADDPRLINTLAQKSEMAIPYTQSHAEL